MNEAKSIHERILELVDEQSFIEIGGEVGSLNGDSERNAGVVTGHGLIDGKLVFLFAQDASVQGGGFSKSQQRKIRAVYEKADLMRAPVIEIIDSSGIRLDHAMENFRSFLALMRQKATLKGSVPLVSIVLGHAIGLQAPFVQLSDFILMEDSSSMSMIPADAIEGNRNRAFPLAGHCAEEKLVNGSGTYSELATEVRQILSAIPHNNRGYAVYQPSDDPLNRIVEGFSGASPVEMLEMISDNSDVRVVKEEGSFHVMEAVIKLNGQTVYVISVNGERIGVDDLREVEQALNYCSAFHIPVLYLVRATGFSREKNQAMGLGKAFSDVVLAQKKLKAGTVSLILEANSSAGFLLGSHETGSDFVFALPDSKLSLMDVRAEDLEDLTEDAAGFLQDENSLQAALSCGLIDRLIAKAAVRQELCAAFELLFTKNIGND